MRLEMMKAITTGNRGKPVTINPRHRSDPASRRSMSRTLQGEETTKQET